MKATVYIAVKVEFEHPDRMTPEEALEKLQGETDYELHPASPISIHNSELMGIVLPEDIF